MPKVSLILAGAVSLGSVEAGVLDEILYVLDRLNRELDPEDRYRIDSIAGASAGAMTGALVAQAVMRGFGKRSLLREAWVEHVDITRLLDRIPPNALLSKLAVEEIGAAFLPWAGTAPGSDDPSSLADESLRLAFTVTNLTGVIYRLADSSDRDDARFESTFHSERRDFVLRRDVPADDRWPDIRATAIASGSFPLAFPPARLAAAAASWPGHALDPFPEAFWYVDGGMFNNEPVGEAVRLARLQDDPVGCARLDPDRRFILVDPNLNRSTHDPGFSADTSMAETARRLVSAVMGEATANDWLKALRRNNEVEWRDRLVATLAMMVGEIRLDAPDAFVRQVEAAAEDIVDRKRADVGRDRYPADYRERAVDRLTRQHAIVAGSLGPMQRRIFGNLVFILNSVAGLDRKQQLHLHMIHTDGAEVAGDQLHNFAGFFSRDWRDHDYTVGRARARAALPRILDIAEHQLPEPEPDVRYRPATDLREVTMDHAPREAREKLREAMLLKVKEASRELALGSGWIRWAASPIARFVIRRTAKSQLSRQLAL